MLESTSREHRQSLEEGRGMFYRSSEMEETLSKLMKQQQQQLPGSFLQYPPSSAFGILQQQALQQQQRQGEHHHQDDDNDSDDFDSDSIISSPSSKKRCYDDADLDNEESLHQKEKRLRTTILPEQLDFLYQKYALDSNPSRKMLEQIAGEVGLRKRVVQVWFQNTRARERKGQFRSHSQLVINKRCPLCPEVFKMRTALEAHLANMHSGEPIGMIDIDALPNLTDHSDDEDELPSTPLPPTPQIAHNRPSLSESPFPLNDQLASLMPNATSAYDLQNSMRKYYEDTMKRFMNDISEQQKRNSGQEALDLSMEDADYAGDADSDANKSMETESNGGGSGSFSGLGGGGGSGNKRFRTQMSGLQVKMMKSVFEVYKTPTMTECSNLGRDIGLQKRVVQVWFQNARAKEKRAKLQLQQALGREPEQPPTPEECTICNFKYGPKFVIQDHIFNKNHLEQVRLAIEHGRYDPESPGFALSQAAATMQSANGAGRHSPSPSGAEGSTSLSMLQMTTQVNNGHELMELSSRQSSRMLMQV
jgi:AT-binding transcription factor 1